MLENGSLDELDILAANMKNISTETKEKVSVAVWVLCWAMMSLT